MEFTCQSYYFLLSFFLLSGAQQREHKELAPVTVKEIEENKKVVHPWVLYSGSYGWYRNREIN